MKSAAVVAKTTTASLSLMASFSFGIDAFASSKANKKRRNFPKAAQTCSPAPLHDDFTPRWSSLGNETPKELTARESSVRHGFVEALVDSSKQ